MTTEVSRRAVLKGAGLMAVASVLGWRPALPAVVAPAVAPVELGFARPAETDLARYTAIARMQAIAEVSTEFWEDEPLGRAYVEDFLRRSLVDQGGARLIEPYGQEVFEHVTSGYWSQDRTSVRLTQEWLATPLTGA